MESDIRRLQQATWPEMIATDTTKQKQTATKSRKNTGIIEELRHTARGLKMSSEYSKDIFQISIKKKKKD